MSTIGVHMNPTALRSLALDVLLAIAEHGGKLPETHPVAVEYASLDKCCRDRIEFFLYGAQEVSTIEGKAHEAVLAEVRAAKDAEIEMAFVRVASFEAEAEQAREECARLRDRLDQRPLSEKLALLGGALIFGSGVFALFLTIVKAFDGWGLFR